MIIRAPYPDAGAAPMAPGYLSQTAYIPVGSQRMAASYSGPLYTLRRPSDNALRSFPPVGDYVDVAAAKAWIGGSQAFVTELFAQDASGRKFIQPSAANQPSINFDDLIAGAAPILFDGNRSGTLGTVEKSMYLDGLTIDQLNWSLFATIQPNSTINNSEPFEFQSSDGSNILGAIYLTQNGNLYTGVLGAGQQLVTTPAAGALRAMPTTIGAAFNGPTQVRIYTNSQVSTIGSNANSAGNMPRLKIGAGNLGDSWNGMFRLLGAAIYTSALSTTDALAVRDSLNVAFSRPTAFDYRVIFGDDSIQEGAGMTFLRNQPSILQKTFTKNAEVLNTGIFGQLLAAQYGNRVARYSPLYSATIPIVVFIEGGTNDINSGTTGANLYANTTAPFIAWLKALGANVKVVVCTLPPRGSFIGTGKETERLAYNSTVVANQGGADGVLDLAANPTMGPTSAVSPTGAATTYYVDGTHPNSEGYAYLAGAPSGPYANANTYYAALQTALGFTP